jgi:hypothetical protein
MKHHHSRGSIGLLNNLLIFNHDPVGFGRSIDKFILGTWILALMFCPSCGQEQKTDQHFCTNCGVDLTQAQSPGTTPPGSAPPPVPPPQFQQFPPPVPDYLAHTDAELATAKNYAYAGIAIAVVGFFFAGPILAIGAVILGYMAMQKGEKPLGTIAMALGALLFVISMYFVMLVGW